MKNIVFFQIVYLDWWPISRDCAMYALSVVVLIITIQDGKVMWYEALVLVLTYLIYIAGKLTAANTIYGNFLQDIS